MQFFTLIITVQVLPQEIHRLIGIREQSVIIVGVIPVVRVLPVIRIIIKRQIIRIDIIISIKKAGLCDLFKVCDIPFFTILPAVIQHFKHFLYKCLPDCHLCVTIGVSHFFSML